MKKTTNLNLNKPDDVEQFDINHFNQNADIIDSKIQTNITNISNLQSSKNDNITITDNSAALTDSDSFISADSAKKNPTALKRTLLTSLWTYIQNKISSVLGLTASAYKGNSASATKLATARTLNIQDATATNTGTGASFNGEANATIKLPETIKANITGNVTGNVTGNCSGSSGSCSGNAATATTATKLGTTTIGSSTKPIYLNNGTPTACNQSIVGVDNSLTSTSTTNALSANQGKVLNEKFNNYLPLAGGTITGNIKCKPSGATQANNLIQVTAADAYGAIANFGADGLTILSGGESGANLLNGNYLSKTSEETIIASDTNIRLFSNCNTVANNKTAVFNTSGNFIVDMVNGVRYINDISQLGLSGTVSVVNIMNKIFENKYACRVMLKVRNNSITGCPATWGLLLIDADCTSGDALFDVKFISNNNYDYTNTYIGVYMASSTGVSSCYWFINGNRISTKFNGEYKIGLSIFYDTLPTVDHSFYVDFVQGAQNHKICFTYKNNHNGTSNYVSYRWLLNTVSGTIYYHVFATNYIYIVMSFSSSAIIYSYVNLYFPTLLNGNIYRAEVINSPAITSGFTTMSQN